MLHFKTFVLVQNCRFDSHFRASSMSLVLLLKVKVTLKHAMNAQGEVRGIVLLILN